eukprot:Nk52_evm44s2340 gene=Nk52_evmTU44s2340
MSGDMETRTPEMCVDVSSVSSSFSSQTQKTSSKNPKKLIFTHLTVSAVFFFVVFERAAFYALEDSMALYLVDLCDFSSPNANAIVNAFLSVTYISGMVGGFLSDEKYGKWRVASVTNITYCIGLTIVLISSLPFVWEDFDNFQPGVTSLVLFFVGIISVAVANAAKMIFASMLADQVELVTDNDPDAMKSVFFLFSLALNGGSALNVFVGPLLQATNEKFNRRTKETIGVAFYWSYALSLSCMVIATAYLYIPRKQYSNIDKPNQLNGYENKGGVITQMFYTILNGRANKQKAKALDEQEKRSLSQVHVLAPRLLAEAQSSNTKKSTHVSAKAIKLVTIEEEPCEDDGSWELAESEKSDTSKGKHELADTCISVSNSYVQTPNLRPYQANVSLLEYCDPMYSGLARDIQDSIHVVVMLLVYSSLFQFIYNQCFSSVLIQATWMTHPMWINASSISVVEAIACIVMSLISDACLHTLRKKGCIIGPHMRGSIGFVITALAMFYLGVLQLVIKNNAIEEKSSDGTLRSSVSIFYQIPAHFLFGWGSVLVTSGMLEYAQTHTPKYMKTTILSLFTFSLGMGSILSLPMSPLVTEDFLAYLYFGLFFLAIFSSIVYYIQYRKYDVKDKVVYLASVAALKAQGKAEAN